MDDANRAKPSPPSGAKPLEEELSSVTHADTFAEQTLPESGNESAQLSASQKLPQHIGEGSMLGLYQIVRKLGQGGMGAVYEARHTKLKKTVAVKVLPVELMKVPGLISRFEREMEAVGALDHPHIVRAMDAGEFRGTHYLVMEYVEGDDLSALVKQRGVLSVRDACKTIRQAAMGLQHAHEHGLVHRDIKPSNLFLTKSGQVKLLDLGLARVGSEDNTHAGLTATGQMLGTPDYMAPEQWDDTRTVDGRADLYSLGCTLSYLLTGKAPFSTGKVRSFLHIMKSHSDASPPDLTVLRPSVPAELNAIFQRLLAKNPDDRFATAAELVTALEPFTRRDERSRHAPHDEPNASPTPNSNSTSSITASSSSHTVHHAELADNVDADATIADSNNSQNSASGATSSPRSITESMHRGADATPLAKDSVTKTGSTRQASTTRQRVIAAVLLACVVLAGIIIKVTKKDSTALEVSVPNDTKQVEITESGISNLKPEISNPVPVLPMKDGDIKSPIADSEAPIDFATERKVAEWGIGRKVDFQISTAEGLLQPTDLAQLPNEPFHVHYLDLTAQPNLAKSEVELIGQLRKLKTLSLHETQVDDPFLPGIRQLTELEYLSLAHTTVTDVGLAELASLQKLTTLSLAFTAVTDDGMATVAKLTNLRRLDLGETHVGNEGLAMLKTLQQLEYIELGPAATDRGLEHLSGFPCLTSLSVKFPVVTDVGVANLRKLSKLDRLRVVAATDADLNRLKSLTNLKTLNFDLNQFTVAGLEPLQAFPKLESLNLNGSVTVDDSYLVAVSKLKKLRQLFVDGTSVTPEGIAKFREQRPDVELRAGGKVYPATSSNPL